MCRNRTEKRLRQLEKIDNWLTAWHKERPFQFTVFCICVGTLLTWITTCSLLLLNQFVNDRKPVAEKPQQKTRVFAACTATLEKNILTVSPVPGAFGYKIYRDENGNLMCEAAMESHPNE